MIYLILIKLIYCLSVRLYLHYVTFFIIVKARPQILFYFVKIPLTYGHILTHFSKPAIMATNLLKIYISKLALLGVAAFNDLKIQLWIKTNIFLPEPWIPRLKAFSSPSFINLGFSVKSFKHCLTFKEQTK